METHILFFILAGLLIAIIAGYSFWSARREKSRVFSNTFSTRPPANAASSSSSSVNNIPASLNSENFHLSPEHQMSQQETAFTQEVEHDVRQIKISLGGEPSESPMQEAEQQHFQQSSAEPAFMQSGLAQSNTQYIQEPQEQPAQTEETAQIISLYVVAPEGQQFAGNAIQQNLEALGFQFGEYQIFHRHLDSSASPVLFSVANMMQPGVFDINQMDYFSTVGLVFFMHLPSEGNDVVNLRLMMSTVESFAQSMGGFVLDEQQQLFNDETRRQYLLKVAK